MSITITGLKTTDYTTKTGLHFLAKFDMRLDGLLSIPGCALVCKDGHNYHIFGPENVAGQQVQFTKEFRRAACHQAMAAYNAMKAVQDDPVKPELSAAVALVQQIEARGEV